LRHRKPALIDETHFESFSLKRAALFFKTEIGVGGVPAPAGELIHYAMIDRTLNLNCADIGMRSKRYQG
jgi:hypothetical protein